MKISCGPALPTIRTESGDVVLTLRLRPSDGDVTVRMDAESARALGKALMIAGSLK